jgi:ligand-binding sensor domain-containing protein/putative methionine-R-sulfoxide reductase with GAF domain
MTRFCILLFLILTGAGVRAQYIFENLKRQEGLSGKEVLCIFKDSKGFIWCGTRNGLNRFDGSSFTIFNHANGRLPAILSEEIYAICETTDGQLLLGTPTGLSLFNQHKGSFRPIAFKDHTGRTLASRQVTRLESTPGGRIWMATAAGVFIYDPERYAALPAASVFSQVQVPEQIFCWANAFRADRLRRCIWIGTEKGLYAVDYTNGRTYSASHHPAQWQMFTAEPVPALALDHTGRMWVSTRRMFSRYHPNGHLEDSSSFYDPQKKWKVHDGAFHLYADSRQRLWITNWYYKLLVLEPGGNTVLLPDQSPDPHKITLAFCNDILEEEGNLWLATNNGISRLYSGNYLRNMLSTSTGTEPKGIDYVAINSFLKGEGNTWWIAKEDGLYQLDEPTGQLQRFRVENGAHRPNRFFSVTRIGNEYWCGTGNRIKIFNPKTKSFRDFAHYPKDHPVKNAAVTWILEDRKKNIWFSAWDDAIYRFDPATQKTLRFDGSDTSQGNIGPCNSLCAYEAPDGRLWFGYGRNGVRVFDYTTNRFTDPLRGFPPNIRQVIVHDIVEDRQRTVLLATPKGILKLDVKGRIDSITTVQGLGSNLVQNLFFDASNRLWISTSEGIHYMNPGQAQASSINLKLEQPVSELWTLFAERSGSIYLNLQDKLVVLDAAALEVQPKLRAPLISAIRTPDSLLSFADENDRLRLKYHQNFFSIDFSSPQHQQLGSVQYAYMLEGFDKDWVYPGRRQSASYTNVPDGEYRFLVKAIIPGGDSSPPTTMIVSISPPFWKSWWFLALVALLAAAIGWWAYRISQKQKRAKNIDQAIDYFANSLYGENSATEICWDIARNCISRLQLEDCVVYLRDDNNNTMVQQAAYGPKSPAGHEIINPISIPVGQGIVGSVAETGRYLLVRDTSKDQRYIVDDRQRSSELAVPIIHEGSVIGVIDSEHSRKNFFTQEHVKALSTIAAISASKIAEAKAQFLARESEIQLLQIKKLLAESQLMALRAQMNPHFVFNCLNSIQECIITEKFGEASLYLNKFARLFRSVLNNSDRMLVTLQEEIEVLELYLFLEHMRFERSFDYELVVDEELEKEEILIPSMLLQPYVENALWHGLMHSPGQRRLSVRFEGVDDDVFRCVIDDNGIGRKRSAELKRQASVQKHVSRGMSISNSRIDLLKKQGEHAQLTIIDKQDANGNAGGTRVIIELSTYLKTS